MNLLVIEPRDFHLNYEPVFFENDLISLGITDKADVALLNVISTEANSADEISVNLIGPFLINRKLKIGKQVVIQNYANYSVKHHIPKATSETKAS
jgi:flagellar assembly factor FliW